MRYSLVFCERSVRMGTSIFSVKVLLVASILTFCTMASCENQQLTASSNMFALNLYQDLRSDSGNLIVSPIGVHQLLCMVHQGAYGKTETEIASVLQQSKNDEKVLKGYNSMIKGLESPVLKMATRIFVEEHFKLNPNFVSISTDYFLSDIKKEDFQKNPEGSRININNWAEEKTNHKIKDLLPADAVTKETRLVLVNAIHFKADWKKRFNRNNTVDMPFYITSDRTVDVPMMVKREGKFRYMESKNLGAKILELPYADESFSMIIMLPLKLDGLSEMEDKLKTVNLNEEFASLYEQTVNVMVPRFKIEKTLDLNDVLIKKMPSAFRGANFSGIADEPIEISKVLQKAFIEVNEEGTEAAAATASTIRMRREIIEEPPTVLCNHPFAFLIIHTSTGMVLFESCIVDLPSSSPTRQASTHEEL